MELISNYMLNDQYRHMLNGLTAKVFGFDFENWVTGGYFEGDYIPYSFMDDGRIVSNVSANRMKFMQNGSEKNYIQIGTVMTDPDCRGQGLAAKLMNHVMEEYERDCDGIYLFGNLSALDFYRKLNFRTGNQYRYSVKDEFCVFEKGKETFKPVVNMDEAVKKEYLDMVRSSVCFSSFEQINRFGLQMFYTSGLDDVLYCSDLDCFIVLEQGAPAVLKSVLSREKVPLREVVQRIELKDHRCVLGFTPHDEDREICLSEVFDGGDDYRFFYRGEQLESIERDRLYFPDLSHA